ncbi:MAG: hypothetical protein RMJ36_03195 [Candidatus Calescibacterium sp.]|nr:hypothetical protein [Candidatus Calescibacterium sp.]MDW8132642.1 hypothetical protein [Candidatus Calescibacterium sp.]
MNKSDILSLDDKIVSIEKERIRLIIDPVKKIFFFSFISTVIILILFFIQSLLENLNIYLSDSNIWNAVLEIIIYNIDFNMFLIVFLSSLFMFTIWIGLPYFKNVKEEYNYIVRNRILPRDLEFYDMQIKDIGRFGISSWGYPPRDIQEIIEKFFNKPLDSKIQYGHKNSYIRFNDYFAIKTGSKKLHMVSFSKYVLSKEHAHRYRSLRKYKREFSCVALIFIITKSELIREEDTIEISNTKVEHFKVENDTHIYNVFYYYIHKDERMFHFSILRKFTMKYIEEEIEKIRHYFSIFFYPHDISVELDNRKSDEPYIEVSKADAMKSNQDADTSDGSDYYF